MCSPDFMYMYHIKHYNMIISISKEYAVYALYFFLSVDSFYAERYMGSPDSKEHIEHYNVRLPTSKP